MILIASANQFLGESIQKLLEVNGFLAAVVRDSSQVSEFLSQKKYQLIIFGPRFLEKLPAGQVQQIVQSIPANTQVTVLSFNDMEEDLEFKPLSGYIAYQQVKVNPEDLIQYVKDHLRPKEAAPCN